MRPRKRAFTLIEVLTVIAIIAVMVAILLPVIGQAKRSAHQTSAISNMRQCATWVVMYLQDSDGNLPPRELTNSSLGTAVTCDSEDNWRTSCTQDWGAPMVGSFGYLGAIPAVSTHIVQVNSSAPLFIDLFYADPAISPFHGLGGQRLKPTDYLYTPNLLLVARADTSVQKFHPNLLEPPRTYVNWFNLFVDAHNATGIAP